MHPTWNSVTVAELQLDGALLVEDGNHGENRPRPAEFGLRGVPFIRAADMDNGRLRFDSAERINQVARERVRKGIGQGGDVLLSHKGTVGKVAFAAFGSEPFICSPQTTFWRVLDDAVLDRKYLFAYLKSQAFTAQLRAVAGETDMAPYVSLTNQRRLKVVLPPIAEQRAIAHILGTLDDKIELNRQMNQTLDELARTLFRSWFVDFDPVRAKAEGRQPEGMDAATAALFPDRLVDSALGPIPEGWSVEALKNCLSLTYGRALKAEDRLPGDATVMGSNGPVGLHSESLSRGPGIVVGRKGTPGSVTWVDGNFWPIDTTFFVEPLDGRESLQWWYFALLEQRLYRLQADSAVPGLNRSAAYQCLQVLSTPFVMHMYHQMVEPLFSRRFANLLESRTLQDARDTLLPKLLSGEVRVPAHCFGVATQA